MRLIVKMGFLIVQATDRYFPGPLNVAALGKSLPGAECEGRRASPDTGETRQTSELGKPHTLHNVKPTYCCTWWENELHGSSGSHNLFTPKTLYTWRLRTPHPNTWLMLFNTIKAIHNNHNQTKCHSPESTRSVKHVDLTVSWPGLWIRSSWNTNQRKDKKKMLVKSSVQGL